MPADFAALRSRTFIYVWVLGRLWEFDNDDTDEHGSAGHSGSGGAIPGAIHVWPHFRADRASATERLSGVSEQPVQRADVHLSRPGNRGDLDAVHTTGALHECVERPGPASSAHGVGAQRNLGNFGLHGASAGDGALHAAAATGCLRQLPDADV